jgi:hypothetical protein
MDTFFLALTVGFFVLCGLYVRFLREERNG